MRHLFRLSILVAVSVIMISFCVTRGISLSAQPKKADSISTDRKVLWESFLKDCPPQDLPVEVYGENDSLSVICYRSKFKTFIYSLKDRSVTEARHAKAIGQVNRISYDAQAQCFILWHNGVEQLRIF